MHRKATTPITHHTQRDERGRDSGTGGATGDGICAGAIGIGAIWVGGGYDDEGRGGMRAVGGRCV